MIIYLLFNEYIFICPLMPNKRLVNSSLKPFITDITIIKTATPKEIPISENQEIIEI